MMKKIKFTINKYTRIINTTTFLYKQISMGILIIKHVQFPSESNNFEFTKVKLHKISQAPGIYTISIWL